MNHVEANVAYESKTESKDSVSAGECDDNLLDSINDEHNIVKIEEIEFHLGDIEKRRISFGDKNNEINEIVWFQKDSILSRRKIFISINVKRVSAIDNVDEEYRMRFDIEFNWILTEEEYISYLKYKNINNNNTIEWTPKWYPKLDFTNSIEQHSLQWAQYNQYGVGTFQVSKFGDLYKNADIKNKKINFEDIKIISCKLECDFTLAEELELQSFPFDCQDLTCLIRENSNCEFLPDLRKNAFASIDLSVSIIDEWEMDSAMLEFGFSDIDSLRELELKYTRIVLRLKMRRKFFAILLNILIPTGFICGLSLTSFSLHAEEEIGERLNLLITLIMTVIAFQYIVSEQLPNVSYLTYIDKYVLMSYLFLTSITIENSFGRIIGDEYDKGIFFKFCCSIFIIYQISFAIYAIQLRKNELKKLIYNTEETEREVNFEKEVLEFNYKKAVYQPQQEKSMKYIFSVLGPDEQNNCNNINNQFSFFNLF